MVSLKVLFDEAMKKQRKGRRVNGNGNRSNKILKEEVKE